MNSSYTLKDGTTIRVTREIIDVTVSTIPNKNWLFTDKAGHNHRWFSDNEPMESYNPQRQHHVPTVQLFVIGKYIDFDGTETNITEYRCTMCGEIIEPGYTHNDQQIFIPGLMRAYINGQPCTKDELNAVLIKHGLTPLE